VHKAQLAAALRTRKETITSTAPAAVSMLKGEELDQTIRAAIRAINNDQGGKRLNIKQQQTATMRKLRQAGIASKDGGLQRKVERILGEPEFKATRGAQGVRRS
jgi:hypothetical protein